MCCNEFAVANLARIVGGVKWEPSKKPLECPLVRHYKLNRVLYSPSDDIEGSLVKDEVVVLGNLSALSRVNYLTVTTHFKFFLLFLYHSHFDRKSNF